MGNILYNNRGSFEIVKINIVSLERDKQLLIANIILILRGDL